MCQASIASSQFRPPVIEFSPTSADLLVASVVSLNLSFFFWIFVFHTYLCSGLRFLLMMNSDGNCLSSFHMFAGSLGCSVFNYLIS